MPRLPTLVSRAVLVAAGLVLSVAIARAAQESPQISPAPSMTPLRGDLYRLDFDGQTTLVAVTREGILLIDPLNSLVASWLKEELERRFPDTPVRYVVYTHHAFDRASGAAAFNETAELVAHERFTDERQRVASRFPTDVAVLDRNRDGAVDAQERAGSPRESTLATFDRDDDGVVTVLELYSRITSPESTYGTRRAITLGGRRVELVHVPVPHAADMTAVYFPAERVLFTAGTVVLRALPASLGSAPARTLAAVRMLEGIGFETIVTGAGDEGTEADVSVVRQYLEALTSGVKAGFVAGRTVDEIAQTLPIDGFAGLSNVATRRTAHIAEVYATLQPIITSVRAVVQLNRFGVEPGSCDRRIFDICQTSVEKSSAVGTVGVHTSIGRLVLGGEMTAGRPVTRRVRASDDFFAPVEDVLQYRESVISALVGYAIVEKPRFLATVEGGPAFIFSRIRDGNFIPSGSFVQQGEHRTRGWTMGGSFVPSISRRLAVVVPVRLTTGHRGTPEVGSVNLTIGAGVVVNAARGAR